MSCRRAPGEGPDAPRVENGYHSYRHSVRHRGAFRRRQDQPHARAAGAGTADPPVGVVHDASAASRRARWRRLPLRHRGALRGAPRSGRVSRVRRTSTATGTRRRRRWLATAGRNRPGRAAGNRLARRRAGAQAYPDIGAHFHPAAFAGRAAESACTDAARTTLRPSRAASRPRGTRYGIARSSIMLLLIRTLLQRSTT